MASTNNNDETQRDLSLLAPQEDVGEFGNPMFRWTVFYAFVIFSLTLMPLWLSGAAPSIVPYVNAGFIALFSLIWIAIALNAVLNFRIMEKIRTPTLAALKASRVRKFKHVVIVPCYLDPIEVLFDAIGSLLLQADLSNLVVVVAFEAKTPDLESKIATVRAGFDGRFGDFLISVHTLDRSKEIAGGCSNKNYALRFAHRHLQSIGVLGTHSVTLTTCDTDSLFHPNYFTVLEQEYNCANPSLSEPPRMMAFQPPLFYNWDLDQRPFFNRITGIMRSMMMLGGLISFNLNPMSIFSYPLELGLRAGFINPRYGVDDIIAKVRWMCDTDEKVPVVMLPIPVISGPTIGVSFFNEVEEWARQIRRWIVGSSESFHYFVIHFKGRPFFAGVQWFFMFFMYYAVLLCSAGLYSLLAGIPLPWVDYPSYYITEHFSFSLSHVGIVALAIQYLVFGVAFIIDRRAVRMMTITEDISIFRNILHWLLAPPTLLVYSMIAFFAIVKFVFVGKKMARHDMAAKDGLGSTTAGGPVSAPHDPLLGDDNNRPKSPTNSTSSESSLATNPRLLGSGEGAAGGYGGIINVDGGHAVVSVEKTAPTAPAAILCQLPEKFSFGAYSVRTADITYRKQPTAAAQQ